MTELLEAIPIEMRIVAVTLLACVVAAPFFIEWVISRIENPRQEDKMPLAFAGPGQIQRRIDNLFTEYYNTYICKPANRGVKDDGSCAYYDHTTGKMCSVGRCLNAPKDFEYASMTSVTGLSQQYVLDDILKPQYRGLDVDLWADLQEHHDLTKYWYREGLTALGKSHWRYLRNRYTSEPIQNLLTV